MKDLYVVNCCRTAIGSFGGSLKNTPAAEMGAVVVKEALSRAGVEPEQVTPLQRRHAKAVNFGIVYGISAFSLSQDIGVSVAEAKAYMEAYFATFPGVRTYMDAIVERAREQGYVETLFHRRRDLPELKSSNFNLRSFGERVALNMPIQGTAADIMKLSLIHI